VEAVGRRPEDAVAVQFRPEINIYLVESQNHMRNLIRNALQGHNFRGIRTFSTMTETRDAMRAGLPDFMIFDTTMPDGDPIEFVKELRNGKIGQNPFVPVLITTWEPTAEIVRRVADSGADDLLVKPLSPHKLFERMAALIDNRKPFVVTSDYVGPDRRKDAGRGSQIPQIDVPNTLKAKAKGEQLDRSALAGDVGQAIAQMNVQRLQRHSFQINFLIKLMIPAYRDGTADMKTLEQANKLVFVAEDAQQRLEGTMFAHVSELCATLVQVARSIQADHPIPRNKDLELLTPLSDAILLGFNPNKTAASLAGEITSAVDIYMKKVQSGQRVY